jgi:hypothetical protein
VRRLLWAREAGQKEAGPRSSRDLGYVHLIGTFELESRWYCYFLLPSFNVVQRNSAPLVVRKKEKKKKKER